MSKRSWIICFTSVIIVQLSISEPLISDEENVLKKILKNYDNQVPPIDESIAKTTVSVSLNLAQILSVREKKQEMATSVFLTLVWEDNRLTYDASAHGGVNVSRVPADNLWVPDLILQNSNDKEKFEVSLKTDVLVYDTGKLEWLPPALYSSSCEINVELFPFDTQNCTMIFRSMSLSSQELLLTNGSHEVLVDKKVFVNNSEWDLISKPSKTLTTIRGGVEYDEVTFYFILKRKPQFYIMNLIVPCILMMTFSCFTFFLPVVSGEKMTLSVSTLLGETVFLFLIAQRMPETSTSVPLIGLYLIFSMTLIILCVVLSVIVCNVHYRSSSTHHMSSWVQVHILGHLARILRMERPTPTSPWQIAQDRRNKRLADIAQKDLQPDRSTRQAPSERCFDIQASRFGFRRRHVDNRVTGATDVISAKSGAVETQFIPAPLLHTPKAYRSVVEGIVYIADKVKNEEIKGKSSDDWQYCAAILDRLFFWIYTSVFTIGTLAFYIRVATASYPVTKE